MGFLTFYASKYIHLHEERERERDGSEAAQSAHGKCSPPGNAATDGRRTLDGQKYLIESTPLTPLSNFPLLFSGKDNLDLSSPSLVYMEERLRLGNTSRSYFSFSLDS